MLELLPPLSSFALSASITPGPNTIMLAASGVNFGFRRTVPHMLGVCIGFPAMIVLVGLGLTGIFVASPEFHRWLKYIGIAYLLYLAYRVATSGPGGQGKTMGRPLGFVQAALFQWVNPKAWIMAVGAITAYTTVQGDMVMEIALIAAVFFVIGVPCVALWAAFGIVLGRWLRSPRTVRLFNGAMAILMVASIVPMLFR